MEYSSRPSRRFAQATNTSQNSADQKAPPIDPQGIQTGQSIYDQTGEEYVVLQNDPTNTDKIIMPKAEEGQPIPQDVKQIPEQELVTTYNLQPTQQTAKRHFSEKLNKENLTGGLGDGKDICDVDLEELLAGIKVELEHTDDIPTAVEIAMDHLTEDEEYYTKLKTIEKKHSRIEPDAWKRIAKAIGYRG